MSGGLPGIRVMVTCRLEPRPHEMGSHGWCVDPDPFPGRTRALNGYLRLPVTNELCPFLCDFWCNHAPDEISNAPASILVEHRELRRERVRRRWAAKHRGAT